MVWRLGQGGPQRFEEDLGLGPERWGGWRGGWGCWSWEARALAHREVSRTIRVLGSAS